MAVTGVGCSLEVLLPGSEGGAFMRPLFFSTVRLPASEDVATSRVTSLAITSVTETTATAITGRLATCPSGKASLRNVGTSLAVAAIGGRAAMVQKSPKAIGAAPTRAAP